MLLNLLTHECRNMVAQHACGVIRPCVSLWFQSDESVGGSIYQLRKVLYVINCVLDSDYLHITEASPWDST